MVLALMQPYFFPYLGYFRLMAAADRFILFDTAQYINRGWVNRNRILHPTRGWQYITVPVRRHGLRTAIKDVEIATDLPWRARIKGQFDHYRKRAPYFVETMRLLDSCVATEERAIGRLNRRALSAVSTLLGLPVRVELMSELALDVAPVRQPGEWSLRVAQAVGATVCVVPPGGAYLYDLEAYERSGIELVIQPGTVYSYGCRGYSFEPSLSVLDVLMWRSPDEVRPFLFGGG